MEDDIVLTEIPISAIGGETSADSSSEPMDPRVQLKRSAFVKTSAATIIDLGMTPMSYTAEDRKDPAAINLKRRGCCEDDSFLSRLWGRIQLDHVVADNSPGFVLLKIVLVIVLSLLIDKGKRKVFFFCLFFFFFLKIFFSKRNSKSRFCFHGFGRCPWSCFIYACWSEACKGNACWRTARCGSGNFDSSCNLFASNCGSQQVDVALVCALECLLDEIHHVLRGIQYTWWCGSWSFQFSVCYHCPFCISSIR